ncbi:Lrp/AsnC family transcriptional regulator [bacterium]|nr:Lrp/AsnC family transcriptional regulator [bacterium]MBU1600253.1 Lrp/AsnC family transcriptional regulator [bacterium]
MKFSETDRKIIKEMSGDIALSKSPYQTIAKKIGIMEEELLAKIDGLKKTGIIRRVCAILYHVPAGYPFNALVVWKVGPEDVERCGKEMSEFQGVTHCYERQVNSTWGYNFFTMIHGRKKEDCEDLARKMAEKTGIKEFRLLYTKRELKKRSPRYE